MTQSNIMPGKLRLSPAGLKQVDARLEQLGWGKQSALWSQQATVSVATLRRFRARRRLTAATFQAICQALGLDWVSVAEPFLMPQVVQAEAEVRVERDEILQRLVSQLQRGYRVLVITGITGIGKTVLTEQLSRRRPRPDAKTLSLNFDLPHQRLPFGEIAAYSLRQLGQAVTEDEQQHPTQLMKRWLALLTEEPCWVVMDSVEHLLQGDEHHGWSVFNDPLWPTFFHELIGAEHCASHFVLTSQDTPADVEVPGLRYHHRLHIEPLGGFSPAAQQQLFAGHGFQAETDAESWSCLMRIGRAYEGHPLALQVILGELLDLYDSDVMAYWQHYGHEIEVVEAMKPTLLEDDPKPQLDRYSRRLRKAVRSRIEQSFQRLQRDSPDAFLLLCTAAVYRDPVSAEFLVSPMQRRGWPAQRCQLAVETLLERRLLEIDGQQRLRQHNLIRSVALSYFEQFESSASS